MNNNNEFVVNEKTLIFSQHQINTLTNFNVGNTVISVRHFRQRVMHVANKILHFDIKASFEDFMMKYKTKYYLTIEYIKEFYRKNFGFTFTLKDSLKTEEWMEDCYIVMSEKCEN